jgi:hypothetical protein
MTMRKLMATWSLVIAAGVSTLASVSRAADQWVTYEGGDGPGKGKSIVFVSGDEEYRSEEGLPQLAKILSKHHGFKCTVVFAVDEATGEINPNNGGNIPGLQALDTADLMVILTRFRHLPEDQMKHIDDFLMAGKPVIGLRTATHAFSNMEGTYAKYNNGYNGKDKNPEWKDGFGRLVLGEKWISHHGSHMHESTRGVFAPDARDNAILKGIKDGEIWGSTDVYGVRLPMLAECKVLVLGQVQQAAAKKVDSDPDYGMKPTDEPLPATDKKNNPMMPIAWTKTYQLPGGKAGRSFTTTMGASTDLMNEALRRLLVNATYDLLGMPVPEKADVAIVGDYKPHAYKGGGYTKGVKPSDLK